MALIEDAPGKCSWCGTYEATGEFVDVDNDPICEGCYDDAMHELSEEE
jgi:formylmethanofuran dehydrogenase subunit E